MRKCLVNVPYIEALQMTTRDRLKISVPGRKQDLRKREGSELCEVFQPITLKQKYY